MAESDEQIREALEVFYSDEFSLTQKRSRLTALAEAGSTSARGYLGDLNRIEEWRRREPESPNVTLTRQFEQALADVACDLEATEGPVEADLRSHLAQRLGSALSAKIVVRERELTINLQGWAGVGSVDLAVDLPDSLPALFELKWGAGTLFNCAWDAAKLALAKAEGATDSASLVAGAPVSEWEKQVPGSELFPADAVDFDTAAFLATHAAGFRKWRSELTTRPRRLPDKFTVNPYDPVRLTIGGEPWELRNSSVHLFTASRWIEVSEDGDASPTADELGPTRRY